MMDAQKRCLDMSSLLCSKLDVVLQNGQSNAAARCYTCFVFSSSLVMSYIVLSSSLVESMPSLVESLSMSRFALSDFVVVAAAAAFMSTVTLSI